MYVSIEWKKSLYTVSSHRSLQLGLKATELITEFRGSWEKSFFADRIFPYFLKFSLAN